MAIKEIVSGGEVTAAGFLPIGPWEAVIILAVLLMIFGVGKIPKVMKQLGRGVKELREGVDGGESEEKV